MGYEGSWRGMRKHLEKENHSRLCEFLVSAFQR